MLEKTRLVLSMLILVCERADIDDGGLLATALADTWQFPSISSIESVRVNANHGNGCDDVATLKTNSNINTLWHRKRRWEFELKLVQWSNCEVQRLVVATRGNLYGWYDCSWM